MKVRRCLLVILGLDLCQGTLRQEELKKSLQGVEDVGLFYVKTVVAQAQFCEC